MPAGFLILHGYEGNSPEHWQTWLAGELRERGHAVRYPDLPEPFQPNVHAWLGTLGAELEAAGDGATVICHSLACILWFWHAARAPQRRAGRVMLVAPASAASGVEDIQPFFPVPLDRDAVAAAGEQTRILASDNDPFNPEGARATYGEPLGIPTEIVPGAGHLNATAGWGPWPEMLAWCLGQRATPAPEGSGAKNGVET